MPEVVPVPEEVVLLSRELIPSALNGSYWEAPRGKRSRETMCNVHKSFYPAVVLKMRDCSGAQQCKWLPNSPLLSHDANDTAAAKSLLDLVQRPVTSPIESDRSRPPDHDQAAGMAVAETLGIVQKPNAKRPPGTADLSEVSNGIAAVDYCRIVVTGTTQRFVCKHPGCAREYASRDAVRKHCRIRHEAWLKTLVRTSAREVDLPPSGDTQDFVSKSHIATPPVDLPDGNWEDYALASSPLVPRPVVASDPFPSAASEKCPLSNQGTWTPVNFAACINTFNTMASYNQTQLAAHMTAVQAKMRRGASRNLVPSSNTAAEKLDKLREVVHTITPMGETPREKSKRKLDKLREEMMHKATSMGETPLGENERGSPGLIETLKQASVPPDSRSMYIKEADVATTKLRFKVGTRVECKFGVWEPGTITRQFYRRVSP